MKTNQAILVSGGILLAVSGVVWSADKTIPGGQPGTPRLDKLPAKARETRATGKTDLPVIGYLEKRGRTITIKAGPRGPLYSARTADGKVLFENLSADQVRAAAPELHEFIRTAIAETPAKGKPVADASVRVPTKAIPEASLKGPR